MTTIPGPIGAINFREVTSALWRSGQPLAEDWSTLAGIGIRRIIKLNDPNFGNYDACASLGLDVIGKHISDDEAQSRLPRPEILDEIEALIASGGPALVHCTEGKDRTGIVIARYRVKHQGWSKQAAWDEWCALGSHNYRGLVDYWNGWQP